MHKSSLFRAAGLLLAALLTPCQVAAHSERAAFFPDNRVTQRPDYRPLLPTPQAQRLVVCKKPGNEGVGAREDSSSRIARIQDAQLKKVNEKLYAECKYEHLQAAVDAVTRQGTTIYVLPGVYREQPSIRALEENFGARKVADREYCRAVIGRGPGQLSYEEQFRCPHIQNTVAIFGDPDYTDDDCGSARDGKCAGDPKTLACDPAKSACQYYNLQIEGTGGKITDVVFEGDFINKPGDAADGQFRYLNGIRGDRADGLYLRNFTTQIYEFNAIYVIETDGYVFDRLLSRWVDEYAFLSFASDHGLYDYTEGYGVADSVQYPGSGADIYPEANHAQANLRLRQATEVRNSKGHHSALGYSGTAGNAPWVHNNEFYKNQTGMATESLFGGHPGMPQDHGLFENNKVYSNNKDYYKYVAADGPCITKSPRDRGVVPPEYSYFDELPADHQEAILDRTIVCPPIPFPTGTGMIIAGGNYNVMQNNEVFDNWRQGWWLISMPTLIHMINDPYAPKVLPAELISVLGPLGGLLAPVNDIVSALAEAVKGGSLPLLLQQPIYTSHYNRFIGNHFGENTLGATSLRQPNGIDFWWDGSGKGNCWKDNTAVDGTPSKGGDSLHPRSSDCPDGNQPDLITQLVTAYPPQILQYLPCLLYSRTDPDSKALCPFFTELSPPAGREGGARVTSLTPTRGSLSASGASQVGYFVLHNETGAHHGLKSASVRITGKRDALPGLRLTVNGTASAPGVLSGDVMRFTFASPVQVERSAATLVELETTTTATAGRVLAGDGNQLASLGASLGLGGAGMLLMLGAGVGRRQRLLMLAAVLAATALAGCGDDSGSSAGGGSPNTRVDAGFSLTALEFDDSASGTTYQGLPLEIGGVAL